MITIHIYIYIKTNILSNKADIYIKTNILANKADVIAIAKLNFVERQMSSVSIFINFLWLFIIYWEE